MLNSTWPLADLSVIGINPVAVTLQFITAVVGVLLVRKVGLVQLPVSATMSLRKNCPPT